MKPHPAVGVRFLGNGYTPSKIYHYLVPPRCFMPAIGALVLTSTNWPTLTATKTSSLDAAERLIGNVGVAQVVEQHDNGHPQAVRFYVRGVTHLDFLDESLADIAELGAAERERQEIQAQLDAMLTSPEIVRWRYEAMAEVHPPARKLLERLKALGG